jgi:hypothetical protein
MEVALTAEEVPVLVDVLDSALRQVREEVYKSEVADYKAALKRREAVLTSVLERLGVPRPSA